MSLTLEFQENVAVLTHDDGKRNVFSPDAIQDFNEALDEVEACLLYTSPSPRDMRRSRMPSSA